MTFPAMSVAVTPPPTSVIREEMRYTVKSMCVSPTLAYIDRCSLGFYNEHIVYVLDILHSFSSAPNRSVATEIHFVQCRRKRSPKIL